MIQSERRVSKKSCVIPCSVTCQTINEIFQSVILVLNCLRANTSLIFHQLILLIAYLWSSWKKLVKMSFNLYNQDLFCIISRPKWHVLLTVRSVINNQFAGVQFRNDLANTSSNSSKTKQQTFQSQEKNVYSFSVSKTKVKRKRQEYNKCWIENKSYHRSLVVTSVCGSPLKKDSLKIFLLSSCTPSSIFLFAHYSQF